MTPAQAAGVHDKATWQDQFIWPAHPLPPTVELFFVEASSLAAVGQALDFTMDYVVQLCLIEPRNCALLLDTLDWRIEDMQIH